jgi:hypothetical protein
MLSQDLPFFMERSGEIPYATDIKVQYGPGENAAPGLSAGRERAASSADRLTGRDVLNDLQ